MSWLIKGVLDWAGEKLILLAQWLFGVLDRMIKAHERQKVIKEKAKQSVEPLKKAQTADEISKATDAALDDF